MNTKFAEQVKLLQTQEPLANASYYCITFLGTDDGRIETSCQTSFRGYTETTPRREIRAASTVIPEKMISLLASIGEPGLLVNTRRDVFIYLLFGGHGVIEQTLCEQFFSEIVSPKETVYSYAKGFLSVKNVSPQVFNRAPSKKLRMEVLKRDGRRCKICGRSPADYVDVELHLHHIQPWGSGGITEKENLITICKTCHDGLDPHFDYSLFPLIGVDPIGNLIENRANYIKGIENYQKISFAAYRKDK